MRSLEARLSRNSIVLSEEANHLPVDLQTVRAALNAYARAVSTPWLQLRMTSFRVYGLLSKLSSAYQLRFDIPAVEKITPETYRQLVACLTELASFEDIINDYDQYLWRGATYREFRLWTRRRSTNNCSS